MVAKAGRRQFIYTVKVCELITHIKRFVDQGISASFWPDRRYAGRSDACFLFQLPPIELVGKTFRQRFDEDRFLQFIRNLVNHLDKSKRVAFSGNIIKRAFAERVGHYIRLGAMHKWMPSPSDSAFGKAILEYAGISPPREVTGEAAAYRDGAAFSGEKLAPAIFAADVRKMGDMLIPFFVVQGRDDHITPFEAAKAYMNEVQAPKKEFVAIDGGHYACFTSADQFIAALRQYVRPLAM